MARQKKVAQKPFRKKHKILFVAPQPFFDVRGTPIANKNMLEILSSQYEIDFLSYPIGSKIKIPHVRFFQPFSFGIKKVGIGFSLKKFLLDIAMYFKTKELLRKNDYFCIHSNEESIIWCSFLSQSHGIKFVYDMDSIMSEQLQNKRHFFLSYLMGFFEKKAVQISDLILGISDNFESYCNGLSEECNYCTIWDVPQLRVKNSLSHVYKKKLDHKSKKVLYIGNNESYQGVDAIIELARTTPEHQFILAGVGDDCVDGNLVKISRVPMDQISSLMDHVDVLITPRVSGTNTPMKIYTYMASGKPIVASNIPAHKLLQGCGVLVKQDLLSYKNGIRFALSDKGNYLGLQAKKIVTEKYNFPKLKKLVLNKYGDL